MAWRDSKGMMDELLPILRERLPQATEVDVFWVMNLGCWETRGVLRELIDMGGDDLVALQRPLTTRYHADDPSLVRAINCTSGNNTLH